MKASYKLQLEQHQRRLGLTHKELNKLDRKHNDINLLKQLQLLEPKVSAPAPANTGWYGTLYINNEGSIPMFFRLNVVNDGIETSLYNVDGGFDVLVEGTAFNIEVSQANRLTNISSRIKLIYNLDGAQIGDIDVINIVNEGGGLYDAESNYYYLDFSIEEPYLNGETLTIDFLIIN